VSLIALCLFSGTLGLYWHACRSGFVNYDDPEYVTRNPRVLGGLTGENARWAFTAFEAVNWHPLTWLSLEFDADRRGAEPDPRRYHRTNVLLHAANVLLLFLALHALTGALWRSAVVAALFAAHPLHVESVAWVSERKDVLSAFFGLLTVLAYTWYVRGLQKRRGPLVLAGRYVVVLLLFALGLMAKPMLVTLPCAFLLLDYWPLGRLESAGGPPAARKAAWLVLEKLPLFALTVASCVMNMLAQSYGQALRSLQEYAVAIRVGNAALSYAAYLGKTFWPSGLSCFYPHPGPRLSWAAVAGAALLLTAVTAGAAALARRRPYLVVGWFWFLGVLLPVSGVVQAGIQGMADRFTYLPHIGLFVMLVWGSADLAARCQLRAAAAGAACLLLAASAAVTWRQVTYWHDSVALWQHAIAVAPDNSYAHYKLGWAWIKERHRSDKALPQFTEAVRLEPKIVICRYDLGRLLMRLGRPTEAVEQLREAARLTPSSGAIRAEYAAAENDAGAALAARGERAEARRHFLEALRIQPDIPLPHFNLGLACIDLGRPDEALRHFHHALDADYNRPAAEFHAGRALAQQQKWADAAACYRRALEQGFDPARGHSHLAFVLRRQGKEPAAGEHYRAARQFAPHWLEETDRQARSLATQPDSRQRNGIQAVELAQLVCDATGYHEAAFLDTLAAAHAETGRFKRAAATARQAAGLAASASQRQAIRQRLALYEQGRPCREAGELPPTPEP
jgi:tetratricopeptide (TPR) repeat protein